MDVEPRSEVEAPFRWDRPDRSDARPTTALRSRRGILQVALGLFGWLLLAPFVWLTRAPRFGGAYLSLPIWLTVLLFALLVSIVVILVACVRRSWGVALVSLVLAAGSLVATTRLSSQVDYVGFQYRAHRTALAALAQDYRAGQLNGEVTLPPDVRPLCSSGFAYADRTVLFVQMWQNWRAESGTGLGYFAAPPSPETVVQTASGDRGKPERDLGDGWWWVA